VIAAKAGPAISMQDLAPQRAVWTVHLDHCAVIDGRVRFSA
jgi:hypothetical protein